VSGLIPVMSGTPLLIRMTNTGTQTVAIDAGSQTFTAGQRSVLVIARPAAGATVPRTFLVTAFRMHQSGSTTGTRTSQARSHQRRLARDRATACRRSLSSGNSARARGWCMQLSRRRRPASRC
jgi:hypothetical protein